MAAAIHQFLPSFAGRDAIGSHSLQMQRILRDQGFESEIYAGEALKEVRRQSRRYRDFAGGPVGATWLLYQCSTGSPMASWLAARPEPLIVDYHNITPADLFEPWEPHVAVELAEGRRQVAQLAGRCQLGLGDSAYNCRELDALGYTRTRVVPILLDLASFDAEGVDPRTLDRLVRAKGASAQWLFVGRVAPHKAQHDVVKAFAAYRRLVDPGARLALVGGSSSHAYDRALRGYLASLGLGDAVEITGSVPQPALAAHYRAADVFVCLSDHEGFCVPILESWHHDVPVVAYDATAVTETAAGAALLLPEKSPASVAVAVERVLADRTLRADLVAAGRRRLADFALERTSARFRAAIEELVGARV